MGKFLESLGVIDGYEITQIGELRAKKDAWFEEIEKYDDKVKEEARKLATTYTGEVFAIVKKNMIKGIYLFEVEKKDGKKNLKHVKTVYTDEVPEEVRGKYDEHVLEVAGEYVKSLEYDKVTLDDKVVQVDPKISKNKRILAICGGFFVGFMLGMLIFDNDIVWGVCWGLIMAPVFSGLDVVISKKRGRKKNN